MKSLGLLSGVFQVRISLLWHEKQAADVEQSSNSGTLPPRLMLLLYFVPLLVPLMSPCTGLFCSFTFSPCLD